MARATVCALANRYLDFTDPRDPARDQVTHVHRPDACRCARHHQVTRRQCNGPAELCYVIQHWPDHVADIRILTHVPVHSQPYAPRRQVHTL